MKVSEKGDLTRVAEKIQKVLKDEFGGDPALALAFTLDDDRKNVYWVTNVSREDGISIFQQTAAKMIAQTN